MDARDFLAPGTLLDGSYRIVRVVGAGGFGVTYEAEDVGLETVVAIKEYYPDDMAVRTDSASVRPASTRHVQDFAWGRARFLEEARVLAQFRHPGIVEVHRFFEANDTAYMVMRFERGASMETWLRALGRVPTQAELDGLVAPLLDALETMHTNGLLHRDVAPDNIIVRTDGSPVLLDFGSARRTLAAKTHALTGMFKQGYSPQEQYSADGKFQGPWSDLYALGATLYRAVAGVAPDEATSRGLHDALPPARVAAKGDYRRGFLEGIEACLRLRPSDRPQSVAELRALMCKPGSRSGALPRTVLATKLMGATRMVATGGARPGIGRAAAWGLAVAALSAGFVVSYHSAQPTKSTPEPAARYQAAGVPQVDPAVRDCVDARVPDASGKDSAEAERIIRVCERAEGILPRDATIKRNLALAMIAVDREIPRAAGYLTDAAALGDVEAMSELGLLLERGRGVDKDYIQARAWYERAAEGGDATAFNRLGVMFEIGKGVVQDFAVARAWYEKAAGAGHAEAMTNLGLLYENGQGVAKDWIQARIWYEKAAAAGNAAAMNNLGVLFENGWGLTKDYAQARLWFERSAALGDATAMRNLGLLYEHARGVQRDLQQARTWYEKSAAEGEAAAMDNLGQIYEHGRGVQKNLVQALRWYEKGAEAGHAGAMNSLGWLYEQGIGVGRDFAKAAAWYGKAAAGGEAIAMNNLGVLYENGRGVPRDLAMARTWYEKAAEAGDSTAMRNLGLLYQHGRGVRVSLETAQMWFAKANAAAAAQ
ncbi:MAG: serine/threonine-protein kinase [Hyphomicrobiaceae bacterium]|nr:serine/threonine-protein kinase [Hyphomicrobiaceae bacterium]